MADDYELLGELAVGGMAKVYLGRRRQRDSRGEERLVRVAIKSMKDELALDPEFCAMFVDEANLARKIKHPNVVPTFDVVSANDRLLIVMEYVEGISLAKLLTVSPGAALPLPIAAKIMSDVLRGLHAAHELVDARGRSLGVVHRDVSPENVLVGIDGTARLFDFGVAKATTHHHVTRKGEIKGKLAYMAPEHQRGEPVDRRGDIYAAGAVLWEAIVGRRLFAGTEVEIVRRALKGTIDPPSMVADVPIAEAIDRVVLRALSRKPDDRFATAAEMADALGAATTLASAHDVAKAIVEIAKTDLDERAAIVRALEERPPPLEPEALTVHEALTTRRGRKRARSGKQGSRRKRPALVIYAVIGVLLGLLILALFILSERARG